jgi:hypothetical protein
MRLDPSGLNRLKECWVLMVHRSESSAFITPDAKPPPSKNIHLVPGARRHLLADHSEGMKSFSPGLSAGAYPGSSFWKPLP